MVLLGSRQAGKARGFELRYALVRFQPAHPILLFEIKGGFIEIERV